MSKVVKVQGGDYKIVVGSLNVGSGVKTPGNIILDTNPAGELDSQGLVTITGDLLVLGNTTTVQSETLTVKDNIIYLNVGEQGAGVVTLGTTAGLQIDRGSEDDVSVLWDEAIDKFVFINASDVLQGIATNSIDTFDDSLTITVGDGSDDVIKVTNFEYEKRILDYTPDPTNDNKPRLYSVWEIDHVERLDDVVTLYTKTSHSINAGDSVFIKCTSDITFNNLTSVLVLNNPPPTSNSFCYINIGEDTGPTLPATATGNVRINAIIDENYIPNMKAIADYTFATLTSYSNNQISENNTIVRTYDFATSGVASNVDFTIDGLSIAKIDGFGLRMASGISIIGDTIVSSAGTIKLDRTLQIVNRSVDPIPSDTPVGSVYLYSKNIPGTGGTGLFFKNTTGTKDELISKTKALLYSLIL
jgi:hypothetical protein